MFEVIISNVNTGRVQRKTFDTREDAERHVERQESEWEAKRRCRRDFRVEIHYRELPVVHRLRPAPAPATTAA